MNQLCTKRKGEHVLDLIKIFDQVVESGSFSKAAQALNMAPSSVARNIDNLERLNLRFLNAVHDS